MCNERKIYQSKAANLKKIYSCSLSFYFAAFSFSFTFHWFLYFSDHVSLFSSLDKYYLWFPSTSLTFHFLSLSTFFHFPLISLFFWPYLAIFFTQWILSMVSRIFSLNFFRISVGTFARPTRIFTSFTK